MRSLNVRFLFFAMILSLSIQTTLSLVGKQFMVEKNRKANGGIIEGGWKFITSKTVTYTECMVSSFISKYKRVTITSFMILKYNENSCWFICNFRLNAWNMTSAWDMSSKSLKKMSPSTKIAISLMTTPIYLRTMIHQPKDGHCINAHAAFSKIVIHFPI